MNTKVTTPNFVTLGQVYIPHLFQCYSALIAAIEAKKRRKESVSRKKVRLEPKREPLVGITINLTDD